MKITEFENSGHYRLHSWPLNKYIIFYQEDYTNVYDQDGKNYYFSYNEIISNWLECYPLKDKVVNMLRKYYITLSEAEMEIIANEILELID